MRLFVAILLEETIKDELMSMVEKMRACSLRGNFTRRENLHLTLHFLGETSNDRPIIKAMERVQALPFSLKIAGIGSFQRGNNELCWAGVDCTKSLQQLHRQLGEQLRLCGFSLEQRPYRPHLTLGREVVFAPGHGKEEFSFSAHQMIVKKISLMESVRINGILQYRERYTKIL